MITKTDGSAGETVAAKKKVVIAGTFLVTLVVFIFFVFAVKPLGLPQCYVLNPVGCLSNSAIWIAWGCPLPCRHRMAVKLLTKITFISYGVYGIRL